MSSPYDKVYYKPTYDENGNAIDIIYKHVTIIKKFPNGMWCPCSYKLFFRDKDFRKHIKSKTHRDNLQKLKKTIEQ